MPQKICTLFRVEHEACIPRRVLVKAVEDLHEQAYVLQGRLSNALVELFCANPDHSYFKDLTEEQKAPLRVERIRRLSRAA